MKQCLVAAYIAWLFIKTRTERKTSKLGSNQAVRQAVHRSR